MSDDDEFRYDEVRALYDALRAKRRERQEPDLVNREWEPPTPLVHWPTAYGADSADALWLAKPILPDQGAVAVFAKGGTGKSLLALWLAAGLATGHVLTGPAVEPIEVLYLDYEMTLSTVVNRLEAMGYDDPDALKRLHYASLPTLAPLDSKDGGRAVVDMATHLQVRLVVIDTFGRAVVGDEDKADTVRAWFRWTGQLLKTAGVGFLRIDHAGKDVARGQRGTSGKNDDVDVVWEMTARGHGEFLLTTTKRRFDWVDSPIVLKQTNENGVLAYHWDNNPGDLWLAGTSEVAAELDALGAPLDISRRKAMQMLRDRGEGQGRANNVVGHALLWRRRLASTTVESHPNGTSDRDSVPPLGPIASPLELQPEYRDVPPPPPTTNRTHTYVVGAVGEAVPGLFDDVPDDLDTEENP